MEKRSASFFSFCKKTYPKFWLLINILILFSLPFSLAGILSCEKEKGVGYKSKSNSPPVISSVSILPEKPYKESELNLSIQSNDPDGDPITYQYQWIRNDEEITGGNKSTLEKGNFKKGDFIRVKVTASDGKVNGAPFLSAPLRILNSPPIVQEVRIEPKVAYVTDRLKTSVKSIDPDGDFIYYTYRWEKNGVIINDENGDFLEGGRFKKGDSIAVIVTPDDREAIGTPKKSEPLVISNSPPLIVSSPSPSVEKTTYTYQVGAKDPDGDPMTFHLKSGPRGMKIDQKTGLIEWEIRKEDKGNHSVEIEVSDDAGAKSIQRYTLTIDFK
jgi:hypothetical protein